MVNLILAFINLAFGSYLISEHSFGLATLLLGVSLFAFLMSCVEKLDK